MSEDVDHTGKTHVEKAHEVETSLYMERVMSARPLADA